MCCGRNDCTNVGTFVTMKCGHKDFICLRCLILGDMEHCVVCIYRKVFEEEAEKPHPFWAEA